MGNGLRFFFFSRRYKVSISKIDYIIIRCRFGRFFLFFIDKEYFIILSFCVGSFFYFSGLEIFFFYLELLGGLVWRSLFYFFKVVLVEISESF